MRRQGDNMLWWNRGFPGDPGLEIIEATAELVANISLSS